MKRIVTYRLIIFTRYPQPGDVKTRLISSLGAEGAAALHRSMTLHTLNWARKFQRQHGAKVEIYFSGGDECRMAAEFGEEWTYRPQAEGDLGRRLAAAFTGCTQPTVVVGTDCPELSEREVTQAFADLSQHDVVLGPAADGGYYLIGLNHPVPSLFDGIAWGTAEVFAETQRAARTNGLAVGLLPTLNDIDRPEDLPLWERISRPKVQPCITIVIPTLNEADHLPATLECLAGQEDLEIVVVDAGSKDETCRIASRFGARVLDSAPGRGRQMNAGAAVAGGSVLLFLHADTRLPQVFAHSIGTVLSRPGVVAGAFRLKIDAEGVGLRLVERGANLRSRLFQLPYGDQAIFTSTTMFRAVGGFPELPIIEDVEFMRRMNSCGRIAIASSAATTSARRWRQRGVARMTCLNLFLLTAYLLGCN